MATIYILYSKTLDKFYVGSCKNLSIRLEQHNQKSFENAYTAKANDWNIFYSYDVQNGELARKIEKHIKAMKSRKYYHDLKKHPEIILKLISKYSAGSSR